MNQELKVLLNVHKGLYTLLRIKNKIGGGGGGGVNI